MMQYNKKVVQQKYEEYTRAMKNDRSPTKILLLALLVLLGCTTLIFTLPRAVRYVHKRSTAQVITTQTAFAQAALRTAIAGMYPTLTARAEQARMARSTPSVAGLMVTSTPSPILSAGARRISMVDGMQQVYIPAGEFLMGAADDAVVQKDEEKPQHKVYLDAFWMDLTPVTNAMYLQCVKAGKCKDLVYDNQLNHHYKDPLFADHPVVYVSWFNAVDYCTWEGGRLPTEAQWEKAARGTDARIYPWGNQAPAPTLLNADNWFGDTTVVGSFLDGASPYGILDMAGNVREWVADWYGDNYYRVSSTAAPLGPKKGDKRSLRGDGWQDPVIYARTSSRLSHPPKSPGVNRGFRCVQQ